MPAGGATVALGAMRACLLDTNAPNSDRYGTSIESYR